ncbi:MAG: hypothetical protein JRI92_02030 [Deltaproteobacteria bacterium]|nr:hypothetical protein [Deltaproteobacteria bacterium]
MSIVTLEGIVQEGQIRLKTDFHLPDKTKVYVVVPDFQGEKYAHIFSPRLANQEQAIDFKMQVTEE